MRMLTARDSSSDLVAGSPASLTWHRWLDETPRPGWSNMAFDSALLDLAEAGGAWLRIYQWDPWCLSFGRNEPATTRYDRSTIAARGIDTVRRPTGGRAVWHARELTYAVAAPAGAFGDLRQAYRLIHAMLQRAVIGLGVRAILAPARTAADRLDVGACFASPTGGEVMAPGGKLVGSAQLRQNGAFLQHGSLLLDGSQQLVREVARGESAEPQATTLAAAASRPISFAEAADAVIGAAAHWPGEWHEVRTPDADLVRMAERHATRFRSPEWTWRR
jgi:lipoate-protein ligase A